MAKTATLKTQPTTASVNDFLHTVEDPQKRADCATLVELMEKATGAKAVMWGPAIIGFGQRRYVSPGTGREVDWFQLGFAPRKANISLYLMGLKKHEELLARLGRHKVAGGCLHIKQVADVDRKVLQQLLKAAAK
ncbi:MAG: DUF1801 domain-containing protein [Chitinophagaceae bacterium]|nr:MAG: DUF1801 domain-containing protein [Chitinophagaceae bacterium]